MKILVCGGRDFIDKELMYSVLNKIKELVNCEITIIQGEARGADLMSKQWAIDNNLNHLDFPADWKKHGNKAGPLRNIQMLEKGNPDLVVAFKGGNGTAHMVKIANRSGKPVIRVGIDDVENLIPILWRL